MCICGLMCSISCHYSQWCVVFLSIALNKLSGERVKCLHKGKTTSFKINDPSGYLLL